MFGIPDRDNSSLYQFYDVLSTLLRQTEVHPPVWGPYYRLPLIADKRSYSFSLGQFAEVGHCGKHGDYARKIEPDKLEKVVSWCRTTTPINWIKAHNIASGLPEDEAAYARQPMDVYIYNPDNLPLSEILLRDSQLDGKTINSLAYDSIVSDGLNIWIPDHYSAKDLIISFCPQCMSDVTKRATQSAQPKKAASRKPNAI